MQNRSECENFVPDEATALRVAEAIWLPIYGDGIFKKQPFVATLVNGTVWKVSGTLNTQKGGVPYIEIQKCTCEVLAVTNSK